MNNQRYFKQVDFMLRAIYQTEKTAYNKEQMIKYQQLDKRGVK